MTLIISILGILITIFFVVGVHEFSHFMTAKFLKVKVLCFSIGFGKTLLHWHDKSGTEYVIAALPLGGYVRMLDESEGEVPENELHLAFNRQPFYKKFLIVLAGPVSNMLSAFILYWIIYQVGYVAIKPVIGTVTPHTMAATAGLQANQEIVSVDGKPSATWMSILFRLMYHVGNHDQIKWEVKNAKEPQSHIVSMDLSHWQMDELHPDPLGSLGVEPYEPVIPLIVGVIDPNAPAASSPLKIGDKLIATNNNKIKDWGNLVATINEHPAESILFTVERQGQIIQFPVKIGFHRNLLMQRFGFLGIGPNFHWPADMLHTVKVGPLEAVPRAWQQIVDFTYFNFVLFGKMLTGKLSLQSLGGPITIFETAGDALNSGFLSFLSFLAFLNISIGIVNILPIPGLDGGHLFFQIIEFVIRRPIPEKYLMFFFRLGFVFLIFILIQALVNDILRMY